MTYRWIASAPEFDSGATKRIKKYFHNLEFFPDLLTSYFAPIGALYFFISYSTDISLLSELFNNILTVIASPYGRSNLFNNGNGAGACSTDVL